MKYRILLIVMLGLLAGLTYFKKYHVNDLDKLVQRTIFYSQPYRVDKIYKSMKGPASTKTISLGEGDAHELIWITGMWAEMVDATSLKSASQDFMCHTNLDFDIQYRQKLFKNITLQHSRLITLSQGQLAMDLPDGYGIPVYSHEPLNLETQVLNLNIANANSNIQHKITIEYIYDRDLKKPLKPLFTVGAQGMVLVEGNDPYFEISEVDPSLHGPGCSFGQTASDVKYEDQETGSKFTGHWILKPGREVNSTATSIFMNILYDTTLHYAEVHVHPFAESLELKDRTTGETVIKSFAQNFTDRLGLKNVDYFSSVEGVPIFKDHEYELISIYNNTSGVDQDAMGHMVLFLYDKYFRKIKDRHVE